MPCFVCTLRKAKVGRGGEGRVRYKSFPKGGFARSSPEGVRRFHGRLLCLVLDSALLCGTLLSRGVLVLVIVPRRLLDAYTSGMRISTFGMTSRLALNLQYTLGTYVLHFFSLAAPQLLQWIRMRPLAGYSPPRKGPVAA